MTSVPSNRKTSKFPSSQQIPIFGILTFDMLLLGFPLEMSTPKKNRMEYSRHRLECPSQTFIKQSMPGNGKRKFHTLFLIWWRFILLHIRCVCVMRNFPIHFTWFTSFSVFTNHQLLRLANISTENPFKWSFASKYLAVGVIFRAERNFYHTHTVISFQWRFGKISGAKNSSCATFEFSDRLGSEFSVVANHSKN